MVGTVSTRGTLVAIALCLAVLGSACARPGVIARDPAAIQDYAMRARVDRITVGQSSQEARAILGSDPVHRPGHPGEPYPSPLRAIAVATPTKEVLRIELYVVAARSAEGCPDVHVEAAPVVFRDGVVAARGWEAVEKNWRGWGGSLAALRSVRDTTQCDEASAVGAPR